MRKPKEEHFVLEEMAAFAISKFCRGEEAEVTRLIAEIESEIRCHESELKRLDSQRRSAVFRLKELQKAFWWRMADTAKLPISREDLFNAEEVFGYVEHPGAKFVIRRKGYAKWVKRSERKKAAKGLPARCQTCNGTGKELIDCAGSAGYRPCPTCNPPRSY